MEYTVGSSVNCRRLLAPLEADEPDAFLRILLWELVLA
jgi:hypothetical protein